MLHQSIYQYNLKDIKELVSDQIRLKDINEPLIVAKETIAEFISWSNNFLIYHLKTPVIKCVQNQGLDDQKIAATEYL